MPVPYKREITENTRITSQRSSLIPLPTKQPVAKLGRTAGISHASKPSMNIIPIITPAKEIRLSRRPPPLSHNNSQQKTLNKTVNPEISSEVAILALIPFARQPTVDFNEVPINSVAIKYVAIRNSLDVEQQLFVKTFPKDDKGFNIDATEFLLAPRTEIFVALSWKPTSLGNVRETITFQDINRHPKRIIITGCAVPVKTIKSIPRFCARRNAKISPCKLNRMIKQDRPTLKPASKPLTNLIFASKRRQSAQIVKSILSKRDDVMATQVQSYCRMILCQRELGRLKEQRDLQVKTEAARLIQSHWRCILARRRYISMRLASLRLQSLWRSRVARLELCRLKEVLKTRADAATLIQSHWRAIVFRRKYIALRDATIGIQSHWRSKIAMKEFQNMKKDLQVKTNAAVLIQSHWRSKIARKEFQKMKKELRVKTNAAILIQSHWRSKIVRKEFQKMKKELRVKTNAAILIQSHWRCISVRRKYIALKQASIRLQSYWRLVIARRELKRLKLLIRTSIGLQAYCRGYLTRHRLRRSFEALTRIQSRFSERKAILC